MKRSILLLLLISMLVTGCSNNLTPNSLQAAREIYDPVNGKYGDRITITWNISIDNSSIKYRIYRALADENNSNISNYILISSTSQTSYTDNLIESDVNPGFIYYKVSSVDKKGKESPLSEAVSIEYIPYG